MTISDQHIISPKIHCLQIFPHMGDIGVSENGEHDDIMMINQRILRVSREFSDTHFTSIFQCILN